ncbi:hypothetical protein [Staphylococcus caprae]|uniref:hypothetical protein n=1 Tax=Staphylococcus caprae TaxID=29380 RepID=UPI001451B4B9|nr:hypothetical protein [Staphylococcus caprae]QJE26641.1 hypothetical protein HHJ99_12790 [Staphylococcus caprae]
MFSKKEMVIGIPLLIGLVLGIGFITKKISNKEAEAYHEYKDWKNKQPLLKVKW